jgi:hypothetical protein
VASGDDEREQIRQLVRELGAGGGARLATPSEIARLREFFGRRVLRSYVDSYIQGKYEQHVGDDAQWPEDTTPEEFLESLRQTVLDGRSSIYLTDEGDDADWSVYFVGQVRRAWRGPGGFDRIVVIFNGERHFLVTGFQPENGDAYVAQQGGFWAFRR